jgi:hypothetical protein
VKDYKNGSPYLMSMLPNTKQVGQNFCKEGER